MTGRPRPPDPELTADIISRLAHGVSTAYVAQALGIGPRAAARSLRAFGCPCVEGKWSTGPRPKYDPRKVC